MARAGLVAAGFALGLVASRVDRNVAPSRHGEPTGRYALLLFGDTRGNSDAVHQARSAEYGRWASSLPGSARWVGGHELGDVLQTLGTPAAETRSADRVAGFFIIEATSPAHAADVARTCPHLKYGGRVVVMTVVS